MMNNMKFNSKPECLIIMAGSVPINISDKGWVALAYLEMWLRKGSYQ